MPGDPLIAEDPNPQLRPYTVRMEYQQQLRQNFPPKPWESGWVIFRYEGEGRSYYLAQKTNGIGLGTLVPLAGEGQKSLVTKPIPRVVPGRWYGYRIEVRGSTIKIYVDGKLQISYTDPNQISHRRVDPYTEDAHILFCNPHIHRISSENRVVLVHCYPKHAVEGPD